MVTIANALGVGSGVDTAELIDTLVAAERGTRDMSIKTRSDRVEARISGMAQVKAGLDALILGLGNRTKGGGLGPLPGSSDASILTASATAGATRTLRPTYVEVKAIATGQSLISGPLANATAPVGMGTLTLTPGTATSDGLGGFAFSGSSVGLDIVIDATNNTLSGLAKAINAAQASVRASVVDDGQGARLVLKGPTGARSAFILTALGDPGLDRFVYQPGASTMTLAASASDADLRVDGVAVKRSTNSISDLIEGTRLELNKAAVGSVVTVAASRDAAGLRTAVGDLVDALNAVQSLGKALTQGAGGDTPAGALAGDSTMRRVRQQLSSLTTGGINGLQSLGVTTARDGTLSVDTARLDKALADDPDAVEAMLVSLTAANGPLAAARDELSVASSDGIGGRLVREQRSIATERATIEVRSTTFRAQLTRQYAAMERAVAASKSTQSFLEAQIKAWNGNNN
ncbi:flagellar filament capping protein FliD [Glacieibacterium sp.]|uniref:flagellar filament capping protein FliD n=1 Tax=Glacieibacterium sp. TaxID=2860237 RepID=UPI003AFF98AA